MFERKGKEKYEHALTKIVLFPVKLPSLTIVDWHLLVKARTTKGRFNKNGIFHHHLFLLRCRAYRSWTAGTRPEKSHRTRTTFHTHTFSLQQGETDDQGERCWIDALHHTRLEQRHCSLQFLHYLSFLINVTKNWMTNGNVWQTTKKGSNNWGHEGKAFQLRDMKSNAQVRDDDDLVRSQLAALFWLKDTKKRIAFCMYYKKLYLSSIAYLELLEFPLFCIFCI